MRLGQQSGRVLKALSHFVFIGFYLLDKTGLEMFQLESDIKFLSERA